MDIVERIVERIVAAIALRVAQLYFSAYGITYWTQWFWDLFRHAAQDGYEWQHGVARDTARYDDGVLHLFQPIDASLGGPTRGYVLYVHGGGFACTSFFQPVKIPQNTFSDRTRCSAQLRPGASFLRSALRFLDRLDWFWQVASALHHVHAQRILHRDLKTQPVADLLRGTLFF